MGGRFIVAHSLRGYSQSWQGKAWRQKPEAAAHIASAAKKLSRMLADALRSLSHFYSVQDHITSDSAAHIDGDSLLRIL